MSENEFDRAATRKRRTGKGTGQPAHFREWTRERRVRNYLKTVRTLRLAGQEGVPEVIGAIAARYRNLHALAQADRRSLLELPGVTHPALRKLQAYLESKSVVVAWAPTGKHRAV
jgi:hypothetical protein